MKNLSKRLFVLSLLAFFMMSANTLYAQSKAQKWVKVSDDEIVTIYYDANITNTKNGEHIVWVKAVYHTPDWQNYFAEMVGLRTPVASTRTKVRFDEDYNYAMVRQVLCYNKAGKQIYNSGDDSSAGWAPVNAGDPVGIVGEYLGDKIRYNSTYGY